jgi:hypothetical protein
MPDSVSPARFGTVPLEQARAMSGLEFLQAVRDGRLPMAPICRALDFALVEAGFGSVVFCGNPAWDHYNLMS